MVFPDRFRQGKDLCIHRIASKQRLLHSPLRFLEGSTSNVITIAKTASLKKTTRSKLKPVSGSCLSIGAPLSDRSCKNLSTSAFERSHTTCLLPECSFNNLTTFG